MAGKQWSKLSFGKKKPSAAELDAPPAIPHPLRRDHRLLALLHLAQAVATSVLAATLSQTYKSTVYFKDDDLFTVPVTALIPAFFGISCLGHLWAGFRANLYRRMARFKCPERWGEYALSASLMSVIIALLCRIDDVVLLAGIAVAQAIVMGWGYVIERDIAKIARSQEEPYTAEMALEDGKPSELFWIACVVELVIWGTTLIYYADAVGGADNSVPWFVHAVVATLLVCYTAYPVFMFWYQRKIVNTRLDPHSRQSIAGDSNEVKQQWVDSTGKVGAHTPLVQVYEQAERGYMVLSFVAKTALGWIVFAGAAMNDKNN